MKGRKKAGMIYKATEWGPHCCSMWLCWEVDGFVGRPPCCSSDKKLNIRVSSKLIQNFIASEILPISPPPHMHVFPAWKLTLALCICNDRLWTNTVEWCSITWDHGNFWVQVSVLGPKKIATKSLEIEPSSRFYLINLSHRSHKIYQANCT